MNAEKLLLHRESRFWEFSLVKWWIRGHGRDGYSFRLLLFPLVGVFVVELLCLAFDLMTPAIVVSGVTTVFLGVAGYYGTKREWLISPSAVRAVVKARTKQAAERFSSLGAGATVLAILISATSISLVLSGQPVLESVLKDAFSLFIALVFLPVYVSGAVRKLAIARIEELEALRGTTTGTRLKFDRAGAVRAVVVQGPAGRSKGSANEYTILGFNPPLDQVGRASAT